MAKHIRVRMYRVGFGDFFLLTVPGNSGPAHILIDCGVHLGNIGSMDDCVKDLIHETGGKLALVIVTHFHADHLSGFATHADDFAKFEVDAVWITNRLDPSNDPAMRFKAKVASVASQVRTQLALSARQDPAAVQAMAMAENALGAAGSSNDAALKLVTTGFSNNPPVYYYEAGDEPKLPAELDGVVAARILGPAPLARAGEFSASDDKKEQYLAALADSGLPDEGRFPPFEKNWPATSADYPASAFAGFRSPATLEKVLADLQPDTLAAAAETVDGTLNNQSLVVLLTCAGKKLLFVGDAQWGNWSYWLYGKPVKGKAPAITDEAKDILGSIDFYKVGHHGSTNATPIPAATAIAHKCVSMCSTETGYPSKKRTYGSIANKSEVPRIDLMEALEQLTGNKLVRSDWIAYGEDAPASPEARKQLPKLPKIFTGGDVYIDHVL